MTDLAQRPNSLPKYARDEQRDYEGDPWLRQPKEPKKAYAAFRIYLDLPAGKRTFIAAERTYRQQFGLDMTPLEKKSAAVICSRWARNHRWIERAEAYDNFLLAQEIAAHKRERVKAATRHAEQSQKIQEMLMAPVEEFRNRLEEAGALNVIATLPDEDVMRLARAWASDLPAHQKSEREALASTAQDTPPPQTHIKAKGEMVRKMLENEGVRGLMEKLSFEIDATVPATENPD